MVKDGYERLKDLGRDGRAKLEDNPGKIQKTHSFLIPQPLYQNK